MKGKGKCLCGSVELEVEYASNELGACHCSMCRNWSGGPMLAIDCADSVKISGESNVVRYKSSDWAERGFCGKCGTHLFYFLVPNNQYHLPVGLLMSGDDYKLTHQIFIDEKPEYYEFKNETQNMTGAEVFAHFESGE
ncbi:GFA family protein [Vibrio sp. 10N.222.54.F12]|uniref:GFA family protein n=1 Tax=Vibrio atlanticus TaxID=693153 RepID=A0ABV4KSD1_9VIBR|nr:GFA family protein [Vibrio tasmaniensis]PML19203.1 aldehyde-activating protein [Vibrio tasmaniensis]PML45524.1 aldehyde-activating protein [Vibrio tasmaniensis]